ncbi:hypothetical protein [Flavobacterium sp. 3HN19-14]|uniref:hypothetical protein n=1 Tax=Flavobacterium sp. 3HN19-14 TaxID=3448133 RepID=UPI003EE05F43
MAFPGSNFETWADFLGGINSFGLKPYATQAIGAGRTGGGNALHIGNTGATNDYVFTSFARTGAPAVPTKLHFYIKGTSTKTISLNVYKTNGTAYTVFNLEDVTTAKTLDPAATNQYTGTINTGGAWTLITLDLSTLTDLNVTATSTNFFALKVGKEATYDIYLDDFTIE